MRKRVSYRDVTQSSKNYHVLIKAKETRVICYKVHFINFCANVKANIPLKASSTHPVSYNRITPGLPVGLGERHQQRVPHAHGFKLRSHQVTTLHLSHIYISIDLLIYLSLYIGHYISIINIFTFTYQAK